MILFIYQGGRLHAVVDGLELNFEKLKSRRVNPMFSTECRHLRTQIRPRTNGPLQL